MDQNWEGRLLAVRARVIRLVKRLPRFLAIIALVIFVVGFVARVNNYELFAKFNLNCKNYYQALITELDTFDPDARFMVNDCRLNEYENSNKNTSWAYITYIDSPEYREPNVYPVLVRVFDVKSEYAKLNNELNERILQDLAKDWSLVNNGFGWMDTDKTVFKRQNGDYLIKVELEGDYLAVMEIKDFVLFELTGEEGTLASLIRVRDGLQASVGIRELNQTLSDWTFSVPLLLGREELVFGVYPANVY